MYGLLLGLSVSALLAALIAIGIAIWAVIRSGRALKKSDETVDVMRDRISKLVRDINAVNELEYNVDVEQQNKINMLARA